MGAGRNGAGSAPAPAESERASRITARSRRSGVASDSGARSCSAARTPSGSCPRTRHAPTNSAAETSVRSRSQVSCFSRRNATEDCVKSGSCLGTPNSPVAIVIPDARHRGIGRRSGSSFQTLVTGGGLPERCQPRRDEPANQVARCNAEGRTGWPDSFC